MSKFRSTFVLVSCLFLLPGAGISQPPGEYYSSTAGLTGQDLRIELHRLISGHTAHSYRAAHGFIDLLDEDPDEPANVSLLYSGASVPKITWGDYNREHVWPQSLGARRRPAKSDMHHIFAADANVNSSRGNKYFDDCTPPCRSHAEAPAASYDSDSWEPPDGVKGDIARALFYMDIRYEGDNNEPDLELTDLAITSGCDCMGRLSTLLAWHRQDPVDNRERAKNNLIHEQIQGNRNPFVDHPEWVAAIWGDTSEEIEGDDRSFINIVSFNIQFLGHFRNRDDEALATIVEDYDVVVVQELVAPPYNGDFPNGDPYQPDAEAAEFFDAMVARGFDYVLSEEDTGPSNENHRNNTSTEWWVTFYNPDRVQEAPDLPWGFLAADRTANPNYERVPYAFPFRATGQQLDFVLISVHLMPGTTAASAARRQEELNAIGNWIRNQSSAEQDYIILGDMNIRDRTELASAIPAGFISLNDNCVATNTNVNGPRPYDHVMLNENHTAELDDNFGFQVIDLIEVAAPFWNETEPYLGNPYDHNGFRQVYSDHHPVVFQLTVPALDDD